MLLRKEKKIISIILAHNCEIGKTVVATFIKVIRFKVTVLPTPKAMRC
jgi:hypothetical protein